METHPSHRLRTNPRAFEASVTSLRARQKTQPYPTRPAPIDVQGVREEDLIDLTPALCKEALELLLNTIMPRCIRRRRGAALFKFRASPQVRTGPALRSIQKPACSIGPPASRWSSLSGSSCCRRSPLLSRTV